MRARPQATGDSHIGVRTGYCPVDHLYGFALAAIQRGLDRNWNRAFGSSMIDDSSRKFGFMELWRFGHGRIFDIFNPVIVRFAIGGR